MIDLSYDTYLERQTEQYFRDAEMNMPVSNCCGCYLEDDDSGICSECREECEVITLGEYETCRYESAMEDKADAERELRRED